MVTWRRASIAEILDIPGTDPLLRLPPGNPPGRGRERPEESFELAGLLDQP